MILLDEMGLKMGHERWTLRYIGTFIPLLKSMYFQHSLDWDSLSIIGTMRRKAACSKSSDSEILSPSSPTKPRIRK